MNWGILAFNENNSAVVAVKDDYFALHFQNKVLEILRRGDDHSPAELIQTISISSETSILALPSFPSKPLILKGLPTLKLLPGSTIKATVTVPLTVKIIGKTTAKQTLLWEYESQTLSQAWIGESDKGTLGFSLFDRLALEKIPKESPQWHITCPLELTNHSKEVFCPSKLFVDTTQVNIYESPYGLISDTIALTYTDNENPYTASVKKQHNSDYRLIAKASNTDSASLYERSFNFFKSIVQSR